MREAHQFSGGDGILEAQRKGGYREPPECLGSAFRAARMADPNDAISIQWPIGPPTAGDSSFRPSALQKHVRSDTDGNCCQQSNPDVLPNVRNPWTLSVVVSAAHIRSLLHVNYVPNPETSTSPWQLSDGIFQAGRSRARALLWKRRWVAYLPGGINPAARADGATDQTVSDIKSPQSRNENVYAQSKYHSNECRKADVLPQHRNARPPIVIAIVIATIPHGCSPSC